MDRGFACMYLVIAIVIMAPAVYAIEPADADLIPEARAVPEYLESIYGENTLSGIYSTGRAENIHKASGTYPAILSLELCGWNSPTWVTIYSKNVQRTVDHAKAWRERGGIVSMQFHWKYPLKSNGSAWVKPPKGGGPFDLAEAVKPGTEEREAVLKDLSKHADYLQQLAGARVPILWRPLHEIDGSWFWWTDCDIPEDSAELWRMIFDYYVRDRKLHDLMWVYSAGLKTCDKGKDVAGIGYRRRCYPGDAYVDISGTDIYPSSWFGWGDYREDTYSKAFQIMSRVSPGKMLASCECCAIPAPEAMAKDGPRWLYCLS